MTDRPGWLDLRGIVARHRRSLLASTLGIEVVTLVTIVAVGRLVFPSWINLDVQVYLEAGRRAAADLSPYEFAFAGGYTYHYSPVFAALMAPLAALPVDVVSVAFRAVALVALALSVRGLGWLAPIVLLSPGIVLDQVPGNVTTLATAAMFAVIRWPSVRTVVAYSVFIFLVPKPGFLPVLLWGMVRVPASARRVGVVAVAAVGMLALTPDFAASFLRASGEWGRTIVPDLVLPAPLVVVLLAAGAALAAAALRWPRLLGPASVLLSPYYYGYVLAPLALVVIPPVDRDDSVAAIGSRRPADTSAVGAPGVNRRPRTWSSRLPARRRQ